MVHCACVRYWHWMLIGTHTSENKNSMGSFMFQWKGVLSLLIPTSAEGDS